MENIFAMATKKKYRFGFKGLISVEDLWDLSVENLDSIFKNLNSELKQSEEESLLDVKTVKNKELDTKIEIVKYIVNAKLKAKEAVLKAKETQEKRQKIMELINKKKDESLKDMPIEELRKMLEELSE